MKKHMSVSLSALLALTLFCVPVMAEEETEAEKAPARKIGVLTMLNMTEDEMGAYEKALRTAVRQLRKEGAVETDFFKSNRPSGGNKPSRPRAEHEIVYYDTLDAMLMALNAGDIENMLVYESMADYIDTPELEAMGRITDTDNPGHFEEMMKSGLMANDFAFMMMESNAALRDEFNQALASITEDEMNQLIRDHITATIEEGAATPVEMPVIDGAETIKVAVTGSLPPMDYVAADGSPAGFNTALLAEISKRIGKNIELVVVDSIGRAAALASGTVDAVFWTRTNRRSSEVAEESEEEERNSFLENEKLTDEERETMRQVRELFDFRAYGKADMPEGTIITTPYYSDLIVPVTTQATLDSIRAQAGH